MNISKIASLLKKQRRICAFRNEKHYAIMCSAFAFTCTGKTFYALCALVPGMQGPEDCKGDTPVDTAIKNNKRNNLQPVQSVPLIFEHDAAHNGHPVELRLFTVNAMLIGVQRRIFNVFDDSLVCWHSAAQKFSCLYGYFGDDSEVLIMPVNFSDIVAPLHKWDVDARDSVERTL